MPNTKKEKMLFSICMSACMVYGMEVYNQILLQKAFCPACFVPDPRELLLLMAAVIGIETLVGGPLARKAAFRLTKKTAKPFTRLVSVQVCTVCLMCPMMSLFAAVVILQAPAHTLFFSWLKSLALNLPMALLWQLLVAGPVVRRLVLPMAEHKT